METSLTSTTEISTAHKTHKQRKRHATMWIFTPLYCRGKTSAVGWDKQQRTGTLSSVTTILVILFADFCGTLCKV